MELSDFPRPRNDNGRGVHWSGNPYYLFSERRALRHDEPGYNDTRNWGFWRDELQAMQIKWVKILDDGGGSGLQMARRLVDIGIMPVVRLYRHQQNPGRIGSRGLDAVREYVRMGAVYFETNNEPDLALEWRNGVRPDNWLDIVVRDFVADADGILALGGYPAVPAFGVGQLRDPYQAIVDMGRQDILDDGAWAAIHNYCLARPLEYPNDAVNMHGELITLAEWEADGGVWAWEMGMDDVNEARRKHANPNADVMDDATCFRAFQQVDAIVRAACGHSIPVMMTEGGYNVGQRAGTTFGDDARYPKPAPQRTSELNLDMFRYMQGETTILGQKVPEYYFAVMPWLIAAERLGWFAPPAENQGPWYTHKYDDEWGLDGELPLVAMLKALPTMVRASGPVPDAWQGGRASDFLRYWDARLDYMGVTYHPHVTGGPHWDLVDAEWVSPSEGGRGYVFVRALDAGGEVIADEAFLVARDGAEDTASTKGPVDDGWGDYAMHAALGTYTVRMSGASDAVAGLGRGSEDQPAGWIAGDFRLTFQWIEPTRPPRDRRDPYWAGR